MYDSYTGLFPHIYTMYVSFDIVPSAQRVPTHRSLSEVSLRGLFPYAHISLYILPSIYRDAARRSCCYVAFGGLFETYACLFPCLHVSFHICTFFHTCMSLSNICASLSIYARLFRHASQRFARTRVQAQSSLCGVAAHRDLHKRFLSGGS